MAIIKIDVEPREETGTHAARRLRKSGVIPGVLYSYGNPATTLKLDGHKWSKFLTDQLNLVNLQFPDGASQIAAPRDIQRDPLSQEVIHVDFQGVKMDETAEFHVLVLFEGIPAGA